MRLLEGEGDVLVVVAWKRAVLWFARRAAEFIMFLNYLWTGLEEESGIWR